MNWCSALTLEVSCNGNSKWPFLETPFSTARYYYDLSLIPSHELLEGEGYTLLLRALNPDGLPVSEEQQLRFTWPEPEELEAWRASREPS